MVTSAEVSGLVTPGQLRKLEADAARQAAAQAAEEARRTEERHAAARKAFMEQDVTPEGVGQVMAALTRLAEQGKHEFLALRFPAELLKDGGRRVNNFDPDWPESLDGFAKRAFDYFEEQLKPLGYRLRAQILDYPNGNLGDVGVFLCW
jgi:hypothetical protein